MRQTQLYQVKENTIIKMDHRQGEYRYFLRAIPVCSCDPNIINSAHFHSLKCPGLDTKLYSHSAYRTIQVTLPKLCGNSTPTQKEKLQRLLQFLAMHINNNNKTLILGQNILR